jgi:hypothetical protein
MTCLRVVWARFDPLRRWQELSGTAKPTTKEENGSRGAAVDRAGDSRGCGGPRDQPAAERARQPVPELAAADGQDDGGSRRRTSTRTLSTCLRGAPSCSWILGGSAKSSDCSQLHDPRLRRETPQLASDAPVDGCGHQSPEPASPSVGPSASLSTCYIPTVCAGESKRGTGAKSTADGARKSTSSRSRDAATQQLLARAPERAAPRRAQGPTGRPLSGVTRASQPREMRSTSPVGPPWLSAGATIHCDT